MYDEININVKIFYYIIRKSGFTTCVKLFRDYYTNIRIKKIETQTLARMGFFVTTPAKKTAGKGVVASKETRSPNTDDHFHQKYGLLSEPP